MRALLGYDFSGALPALRAVRTRRTMHHVFRIEGRPGCIRLVLDSLQHTLSFKGGGFLTHLVLKLLLNTHSTLLMGRLGRYENNIMTWVKPANNKLIDRAIRYVTLLMEKRTGSAPSYATVCRALFTVMEKLPPGEPVVLRTVEHLIAEPEAA